MNEQLKIIITATVDKFKKEVDSAKKEISKFGEEVEKQKKNIGATFESLGTTMANGIKTGLTALAGLTTAILALGPATADYRAEQAKLITAFQDAGATTEAATATYNELYRVMGESDRSVEAANHIAKLTQNEQHMAEWTNICQGVWATFGDSLPIEGLTEAANETAKVGKVTGVLADALNWAGVNEDAFNEKLAACATEQEREALIRTTLNGLYDEAAKKFEENNAQVIAQNEANAKLQSSLAAIGEAVAPVITAFTQFASEALAQVVPYIQQLAEEYGPALSEALGTMAEKTGEVIGWLVDNWELIAGVAVVIGLITTAIGLYNTVQGIKTALDLAETASLGALTTACWAHIAAMAAALAPYLLIVAAVAAVIAIIVLCVTHWDEIKEKVSEVWKSMKEKVSEGVENVKKKIEEMKTNLTNKVNEIKTNITNKFNEVKTNITNKITETKNNIVNKFEEIKTNMKNKVDAAKTTVLNVFDNIKTGIKDKIDAAKNFVSETIEKIKGFFKFEWSLPQLKLPHVSISGEFSLLPPRVPSFSIDWYAKGGVFDKPQLFPYGNSIGGLGEDGAEAIVPLEKNTQWLDKIADKLSEKSGSTPVILQVDGKTFAQTSISTINQLTKQTGRLELTLY